MRLRRAVRKERIRRRNRGIQESGRIFRREYAAAAPERLIIVSDTLPVPHAIGAIKAGTPHP